MFSVTVPSTHTHTTLNLLLCDPTSHHLPKNQNQKQSNMSNQIKNMQKRNQNHLFLHVLFLIVSIMVPFKYLKKKHTHTINKKTKQKSIFRVRVQV